ncbi:hypothetical protein QE152_g39765 [Popillia japonica]|uniref:Uncharacterized protein n=1 Tax=Popillia japonica TaxID=7064 RepID=A0AAW1HT47_POPJA
MSPSVTSTLFKMNSISESNLSYLTLDGEVGRENLGPKDKRSTMFNGIVIVIGIICNIGVTSACKGSKGVFGI